MKSPADGVYAVARSVTGHKGMTLFMMHNPMVRRSVQLILANSVINIENARRKLAC